MRRLVGSAGLIDSELSNAMVIQVGNQRYTINDHLINSVRKSGRRHSLPKISSKLCSRRRRPAYRALASSRILGLAAGSSSTMPAR
jgi:hypothetical protein